MGAPLVTPEQSLMLAAGAIVFQVAMLGLQAWFYTRAKSKLVSMRQEIEAAAACFITQRGTRYRIAGVPQELTAALAPAIAYWLDQSETEHLSVQVNEGAPVNLTRRPWPPSPEGEARAAPVMVEPAEEADVAKLNEATRAVHAAAGPPRRLHS